MGEHSCDELNTAMEWHSLSRVGVDGCQGVRMRSEVEGLMGEVWVLADWGSSWLRWEEAIEKGQY
jgi:hypothetical protein